MRAKNQNSNKILFLILITLVLGLSYGISIPELSFYGDDWIYIYNYHLAGPESFTLFTQWDRPYSAWIYVLTSAVFGESVICYHIFVFILRWLSVYLFGEILYTSFYDRKRAYTAALLFAVYPGFQQQPIAVEYVMHFTSLFLVLLSIRLMQTAVFCPARHAVPLVILSLISAMVSIFTCEYFVGLELARPLFLYFSIRFAPDPSGKHSLKKGTLYILPYALGTAFYFIWRIFIFSFQTYQPKLLNTLRSDPAGGIKLLAIKVLQDLWTVFIKAYRLIFSRPSGVGMPLAACAFLIAAAGVFFALYHYTKHPDDQHSENAEIIGMAILGTALVLFSGIPYWTTMIDVTVDFPWDRPTLSFSPGAAVILTVLLSLALKPFFFCAAVSLLTALSVLFHIQNGRTYINEAEKMNDYFWQLAWRAPGLEKGTIIASDEIPLDRYSDGDLSPVVNWQYAPENRGLAYDYKYFDLDLREAVYYSDPDTIVPVEHTYRTHRFSSSTDKTLGIFYRKNGCLQIIDRQNIDYPGLPDSLGRIAGLSNKDLIILTPEAPAVPPMAIGPEPKHDYCYCFQKTTLAQQKGDPESAYSYASEALRSGLDPVYASDLAPVILAFLEADDLQSAEAMLSRKQLSPDDRKYLCAYWTYTLPAETAEETLTDFYKSHGCL